MKRAISEVAYAKINLALHVRARRADGYHELDTIFAFMNDGDHLHGAEAEELSLNISGPFANGLTKDDDNLVLRTAKLLQSSYNIPCGALLHLNKRVPISSGIGGGSADAAAAARLLNRLWGIGASEIELAELLGPLGADIPACVSSKLARGKGTGTELTAIADNLFTDQPMLLVNPLKAVSTADVFAAWDGNDLGPLSGIGVSDMAQSGRNDLQAAAMRLCPEIQVILETLKIFSPQLTRMSGSGATCFAVFASNQECETARSYISTEFPGYWTMSGTIK